MLVNLLTVSVDPSGEKRLILDLSLVNDFILKDNIKFEDWRVMEGYVSTGCYLYKFEIRKRYNRIEIWV